VCQVVSLAKLKKISLEDIRRVTSLAAILISLLGNGCMNRDKA
jgi:hypothetical protein